jgi:hypothetical protein
MTSAGPAVRQTPTPRSRNLAAVTTADGRAPDLDALLGEVEAEAARRRASPDYPHDLEARIEAELARQAPAPSGRVSLERLVTAVEEASFINIDVPVTASRREYMYMKTALKRGLAWYLRHVADQVSSLGYATARTLRAVTVRIEDIEERVAAVERTGQAELAQALPLATDADSYLDEWLDEVADQLAGVEGRVLCADVETEVVVARLRADGLDAYGLTREGSPYLLSPDVRHGDLIAHLGAVGDAGLGAVVLAGCTNAMNGPSLRAVIQELGRCLRPDGVVAAISEAPWWWRDHLHPSDADLAEARPLAAETWLAGLHEVGFDSTAAYDPDGHSYAVVARREARPEPS